MATKSPSSHSTIRYKFERQRQPHLNLVQYNLLFIILLLIKIETTESLEVGLSISGNLTLAICNHLEYFNVTRINTLNVWAFRNPASIGSGVFGVAGGNQFLKIPCPGTQVKVTDTDDDANEKSLESRRSACFRFVQTNNNFDRTPVLLEDFGRTIFTVYHADGDFVHVLYPQLAWHQAVFACGTHLMNLVSVDDEAKREKLQKLIEKSIPRVVTRTSWVPLSNAPRVWTSGFRESFDEGYKWIPNGAVVPENSPLWNKGKPTSQFWLWCIELYNFPNITRWGLDNASCDRRNSFICEKR